MKRGARQGILVSSAVDRVVYQLLGRCIAHGANAQVRPGQTVDLVGASGDTEPRQENSSSGGLRIGEQNVARIHITVDQALFVGVVEGVRYGGDDLDHHVSRHAVGIGVS